MIFQQRIDFTPPQTGNALGANFKVTNGITREFHIEAILIRLDFTSTGAIATALADGLWGILARVVVTVSDGATTRSVVATSGRALLEKAYNDFGILDAATMAAFGATAATAYQITYPIFFMTPTINDSLRELLLLPAIRYNQNIDVDLTLSTQAQMDSNATPTFAISAGVTVSCIVLRRVVDVANFDTLDQDLIELTQNFAATANDQQTIIPTPGHYVTMDLRYYTTAAARATIITAGGSIRLQAVQVNFRRFRPEDVAVINQYKVKPNAPAQYIGGLYRINFLDDSPSGDDGDFGSLLNTNVYAPTGAQVLLLQDITGGAAVVGKYVLHRILGDLDRFKAVQRARKGAAAKA